MNEPENGPLPSHFHEHADWVKRLSRALVYRDEAEDVAQSTWLQLLRSPPPANCDSKAWIVGVLRRSMLKSNDAKRKAARDQELHRRIPIEFYAPSTDDLVDEIAVQRAVTGAVLALPVKYRAVIVLRYYQDLEPNLIAERLEIPVRTVHTRLRRGREQLRMKLDRRFGSRNLWMGLLIPYLSGAKTGEAAAPPVVAGTIGAAAKHLPSWFALTLVASVAILSLGIWTLTRQEQTVRASGDRITIASAPVPPGSQADPSSTQREPLDAASPVSERIPQRSAPPEASSPSDLANRIVDLLADFRRPDPSMLLAMDVAHFALSEATDLTAGAPYRGDDGFFSWDFRDADVVISLGCSALDGRTSLKLRLQLDEAVRLPDPYFPARPAVQITCSLDQSGEELATGEVYSIVGVNTGEYGNELLLGHRFELTDRGALKLTPSFWHFREVPQGPIQTVRPGRAVMQLQTQSSNCTSISARRCPSIRQTSRPTRQYQPRSRMPSRISRTPRISCGSICSCVPCPACLRYRRPFLAETAAPVVPHSEHLDGVTLASLEGPGP
jgi:RNA polymerase sigma-70 factor (ECF subfamily)